MRSAARSASISTATIGLTVVSDGNADASAT